MLIASIGQSLAAKSRQLGRPAAHRAAKTSQPGHQGQPDRASRGQIEPGSANRSHIEPARTLKSSPRATPRRPNCVQERPRGAPERPKSAQETLKSVPRSPKNAPRAPNRGSQDALERAERPHRSNQGDVDETLPLRSEINENTAHAQQNRRPGALRAARSSQP